MKSKKYPNRNNHAFVIEITVSKF